VKTHAAVMVAEGTFDLQDLPVPGALPPGHALLRVEGNGICGSDWDLYNGDLLKTGMMKLPLIPGHEMVGRIERIDQDTARAWGVAEGDRIAVESTVSCGTCRACQLGRSNFCERRFNYSATSIDVGSGLWGGMAQHMVLIPKTRFYKVPETLSVEDAVLFNPLGNGFEWAYKAGGVGVGDRLLVMGAGQRGLACVIAGHEAGAKQIIATGLSRDAHKLALAKAFGATETIDVEQDDVVSRVQELTGGEGIDVAVDLVPSATEPLVQALDVLRPGGTLVVVGVKGMKAVPDFVSDKIWMKGLRIQGALSLSPWAARTAIELIASRRYPLERMHSHTLSLGDVDLAHRILGGQVPGEDPIHITLTP
jgi:threonine dehydrogenase-like Zn-dependent dehydrogenase